MDHIATPAPGVLLSSGPYERIVAGLRDAVETMSGLDPDAVLTAPPVIAREVLETAGYIRSFPQLVGSVHSFRGSKRDWRALAGREDWHRSQEISDLMLLPAACYHVYPQVAGRSVPVSRFCVHATCFRQEATGERGRMRSFRMSELVFLGPPADCLAWRDGWIERMASWLRGLGLDVSVELADDPFFGPGDHLMRDTQREQQLKWEMRVPVGGGVVQAIASCNLHLDHFGGAFGFTTDGGPAHSACVAFGLDRIALALIERHGREPDAVSRCLREKEGTRT
jgi:seryl-tRNA synthetase